MAASGGSAPKAAIPTIPPNRGHRLYKKFITNNYVTNSFPFPKVRARSIVDQDRLNAPT